MRNWKYKKENGKEVWKELEKVMVYNSRDAIFGDWLDLILNSLLSLTDNMSRLNLVKKFQENKLDGEYANRYMEIVKKHPPEKIKHFANAFAILQKETRETQKDILGDIYMEMITFGQHGQFFTPEHITDLMAKMITTTDKTFCDPCCGSGRFLISASKENPDAKLQGNDIDERCAKMTAINMWMFDLNSEITWGNSLIFENWKGWRTKKGGWIYEFTPEKSYSHLRFD